MLTSIRHRVMNLQRRIALALMPLLTLTVITPMTVSCQRNPTPQDSGIDELRELVRSASGRPAVEDLSRIESRYARTRTSALARFLRGYLFYSAQNYQPAIDALDVRSIGSATAIGDYVLFYRAESEAAIDARSDARKDYAAIYSKSPDSLKSREAKLRAAEMAIALGDPADAIKELARLVEANNVEAVYSTAQAYEAMGKTDPAVRLYRRIYYELPVTSTSVQAEARLSALNASPKDNAGSFGEERSRADALFEAKQYSEASGAYERLLARFPEADRIDEIHLRRGVSLLNSKQLAQGLMELTRVSDRNAELRAEALFHQAEGLRRASRAAESSVAVDRLLAQYSRTRWAADALYDLATYLNKQGRDAEAANRYRQLAASYPKSQ